MRNFAVDDYTGLDTINNGHDEIMKHCWKASSTIREIFRVEMEKLFEY